MMPNWNDLQPDWQGQDVFIIGGGTSLENGFDWSLLKDKNTIGCNAAFFLGVPLCNICIFGDNKFFKKYHENLKVYSEEGGVVVTNAPSLKRNKDEWLWYINRKTSGLHEDALGWNTNTGASAINLALILGAKRIILLGFDMKLSKDGKSNWHDKGLDKSDSNVCTRMCQEFNKVKTDWQKKFADREIINVNTDSALDVFPKMSMNEFWENN